MEEKDKEKEEEEEEMEINKMTKLPLQCYQQTNDKLTLEGMCHFLKCEGGICRL